MYAILYLYINISSFPLRFNFTPSASIEYSVTLIIADPKMSCVDVIVVVTHRITSVYQYSVDTIDSSSDHLEKIRITLLMLILS